MPDPTTGTVGQTINANAVALRSRPPHTKENAPPMTTWFVSRHGGALQWMQHNGRAFDRHVAHLDPIKVLPGDAVIGTLPVHLAAQVCARGRELGLQELQALGATLQRFLIYPHHENRGKVKH